MLRKLLLILLCFALLMGNAFAASDEITKVEAQITVDNNGLCRVTVLAEVRFVSRPTSFIFPLGTDASDITASGASFSKKTIDGIECVVFKNEGGFSGNYTFQCSYSLPCSLKETSTGQRFTAKLPERGWDYPINRFELSIVFPTEITAFPRWSSSYYGDVVDNYLSIQVEESAVTARSNITFRDHETLTMELDFGPETFDLKHLPQKTVPFDQVAFILLYICAIGYWFMVLRKDQLKKSKDLSYNFQASAGEIPCQLFDGKADMGALLAHWGNLGYVLIRRGKNGRFRLEKQMEMGNERSAAERRIFGAIFRTAAVIEVPGSRFLNACKAESPVLKAHWQNRMFSKKEGSPKLLSLLGLGAGLFFSLMVFDTYFEANAGRWVWIILLTLLSLPLYRVLQKVVPGCYRPTWWLHLAMGAVATLILYLFASSVGFVGYFFFTLLLQMGIGYVTRFGGQRTVSGQETLRQILNFRRSILRSQRNSARATIRRDSQYFYRMLPYAEILGLGARFKRYHAPATAESCPWLTDDRNVLRSASDFYGLYTDFIRQIRNAEIAERFHSLNLRLPSISFGSTGTAGRTTRSSTGSASRSSSRSASGRRSTATARSTASRSSRSRSSHTRSGRRS